MIPSSEPPKYKPVDLVKALKNKPRESKIIFKGHEGESIRFILPVRSFHFDDYLSFFAVGMLVLFISWLAYTTVLIWGVLGLVFSVLIAVGLIYWYFYESKYFKEQQVIEIGRKGLTIERYLKNGVQKKFIPILDIKKIQVATSSPSVTFFDEETDQVEEKMFMEYCLRGEKEWIVLILRSIIFNVTNRVV